MEIDRQMEHVAESLRRLGILRTYLAVSYTHLTLPTT